MPPLLTHRITNFQDIDPSTLPCPESDNRHRRVTKDVEFGDFGFDTVDDLSSGGDDIHCRLAITTTVKGCGQPEGGEDHHITYFSPMYCMAAQVPAMSAPGLYERSNTSNLFSQTTYREPERLGLAYTPPTQTVRKSQE